MSRYGLALSVFSTERSSGWPALLSVYRESLQREGGEGAVYTLLPDDTHGVDLEKVRCLPFIEAVFHTHTRGYDLLHLVSKAYRNGLGEQPDQQSVCACPSSARSATISK
jgi:hypothetical protein